MSTLFGNSAAVVIPQNMHTKVILFILNFEKMSSHLVNINALIKRYKHN